MNNESTEKGFTMSVTPAELETMLNDEAARRDYIRSRMGDLPLTYRNLMPRTNDTGVLKDAEARIREQVREDFEYVQANEHKGDPATMNNAQFAKAFLQKPPR
jgi:hypothetical protein